MAHSSKKSDKSAQSAQSEVLISVPSRVWVRICKAGKRQKFVDAVALNGSTFLFDIEGFCEDHGIQLSKQERALCERVVTISSKNLRPKLVK